MGTQVKRRGAGLLLANEHRQLNRLMDELREELALMPRTGLGSWLDRIHERFAHFQAHFIKLMALEEHGGYLADVLEHKPTLSDEVSRLKHEHGEFVELMCSIREKPQLHDEADSILPRDWCARVTRLLSCVEQHEHDEELLLIDAVERDIGTQD